MTSQTHHLSAAKQLAIAGAALLGVSMVSAFLNAGGMRLNPLKLGLAMMLGPAFGWLWAAHTGGVGEALELLVPTTAFVVIPLAFWAWSRSPALLAVSSMMWFMSGWYFAVGMWI